MAIRLHEAGFNYAKRLIKEGEVEYDKNHWQEDKPTLNDEVRYLNTHNMHEYGLWFLGFDTEKEGTRQEYCYPYGDFGLVHKDGLEATKEHAAKFGHKEIEKAAQELLNMINETEH